VACRVATSPRWLPLVVQVALILYTVNLVGMDLHFQQAAVVYYCNGQKIGTVVQCYEAHLLIHVSPNEETMCLIILTFEVHFIWNHSCRITEDSSG